MTQSFWLAGLIPAVFTPMHADGSLHLEQVGPVVERLLAEGAGGFYVCGSTGEGVSLAREERMATAQAYVDAASGRAPVIVQVGHNSLAEACLLAQHARRIGADAISATPPTYFRPASLDTLLDCLARIAAAAPDLPFYYYHIPSRTGVHVDLARLLEQGAERLPTLVGAKYSSSAIPELQACVELLDGRFNLLFGSDEMLLSGLCGGAHGAVGTTYNFALPLYQSVLAAFRAGDLDEARRLQGLSVQMVRACTRFDGKAAFKAVMGLTGLDCGPARLPLETLSPEEIGALQGELAAIGFFTWGRQELAANV